MPQTSSQTTPLQFRVSRADGGAETWTATYDEAQTTSLLRRAVRIRRATVEARLSGGFLLQWTVHHPNREPTTATITAEPLTPARLTKTMRTDLDNIAEDPTRARWRPDASLHVGFLGRIPPATARRLVDRGLIAVTDPDTGPAVRLTLSARLALLAEQHRTWTRPPRGYYRPGDYLQPGEYPISAGRCKGGGKGGLMHDRTSSATCSCGEFHEFAEDRRDAADLARAHRQHVAAGLVATL